MSVLHRFTKAAPLLLCALILPRLAQAQEADEIEKEPVVREQPAEKAAPTAPSVSQDEVDQLRARLRAMEQRVDGIEASDQGTGPQEIPLDLDTTMHVYAAVDVGMTNYVDNGEVEAPPGFSVKDLVFTYGANLDRKMSAYTEVAFEPSDEGIAVDLEVIQINWNISDAFGITAGRVHAPWSYWANTSLHGEYRFLPLAVPEILALEDEGGGWMPIHQVGLWANGKAFMGFWQLSWQVGLSNGRSPTIGWIAQQGDTGFGKAINGHVWLESPGGLLIGIGGYTDQMVHGESDSHAHTTTTPTTTATTTADTMPEEEAPMGEHIGNVTVVYRGGQAELSTEGFVIIHTQDGQTGTTLGGFVVAGLKADRWTPYLVADVMMVDDASPHFQRVNDYEYSTKGGVGVRRELGLRLALKAQVTGGLETYVTQLPGGEISSTEHTVLQSAIQLAAGF